MNDVLGHPIVKGATVLTGDYRQSNMVQITTVDKVTKSRVLVTISNGVLITVDKNMYLVKYKLQENLIKY